MLRYLRYAAYVSKTLNAVDDQLGLRHGGAMAFIDKEGIEPAFKIRAQMAFRDAVPFAQFASEMADVLKAGDPTVLAHFRQP